MLSSGILEVAMGVIFVFMLVSLLCSAVREGLEAWMKTRAAYLEFGIRELLHDRGGEGLAVSFFKHPLIYSLYSGEYERGRTKGRPGWFEKGGNLPSYIPAMNFAHALMDLAARGPRTDVGSDGAAPLLSLSGLRANIQNLQNADVQRVLLMAIDSAQGDLDAVRANLETWYDSAMERVGGWYKRSTQWVILLIALAVAIVGNVNTIVIANYLYRNDAARAAIAGRASLTTSDPKVLEQSHAQTKEMLADLELPIGWAKGFLAYEPEAVRTVHANLGVANDVLVVICGWLLTAFAATLGAPFWFDVLKKVMTIRTTLKGNVGPEAPPPRARPASRQPAITAPAAEVSVPLALDAAGERDCCEQGGLNPCDETADQALPQATGGVV
jgi:hypothetical protein